MSGLLIIFVKICNDYEKDISFYLGFHLAYDGILQLGFGISCIRLKSQKFQRNRILYHIG